MKYVYVLTSSEKDIYYEQFLISTASLRLYNPDAEIIALIDEKTKQGLKGNRTAYTKYISEEKTINVPCDFSQKEASRWIKTSIHHHINGDFMFIDCDTVITENLEYNFPAEIKIGAVLDTHVTLDKHHLRNKFRQEDKSVGFSSSLKTNTRYNGGLILFKDSPESRNFFEKWNSLWIESKKKGCTQDMPALNQANLDLGNIITELKGNWNCQISHNGISFLKNAKLIHCFASTLPSAIPAYKLASQEVLDSIKKTGELSPHIMQLLEDPKAAFEPISRIISDEAIIDALDSLLFFKFIKFSRRYPGILKKWNSFTSFLTRSFKRLIKQ